MDYGKSTKGDRIVIFSFIFNKLTIRHLAYHNSSSVIITKMAMLLGKKNVNILQVRIVLSVLINAK